MSTRPLAYAALPRGGVWVQVTSNRITMYRSRRARRWIFWKRWCTDILASKPYSAAVDDVVELRQIGPEFFVATVNSQPILRFGRSEHD